MRNSKALTATALACLLAPQPGQAQTADTPPVPVPLQEQVITATRVPTNLVDVAAGVTVVDRATIEAKGYNSLSEALQDIPGLHVSPSGGLGGQASVFIRGTNSNQVLVLRDGMPINDASDPAAGYNFGTDTLSDIERIEVIRGPMAAVYGSGAIGGVINLISRRGTEPGAHWFGDIAGGYPALGRGTIGATGIEGPIDYALTAEAQTQRGYDATPQRQNVYSGVPQGFNERTLTLNLGYTPIQGTRLSLFLRGQVDNFGFNTLGGYDANGNPLPTFDNANSAGTTTSLLGRIGGTTHLFDGILESGLFLGQLQGDRHYQEALAAQDPNQATSDNRYHSYQTDLQWNNTLHLDDLLTVPGLSASTMTFGYEFIGDTAKVRLNENSVGGPYANGVSAWMGTNAAYVGLQTTVLERLAVTGQVRQDWVAQRAPTTWRLGTVFDASEIDTHFKLAYGTAFRAPSLFDRYGVDSYGYVGNPLLKTEFSQGWEAGFTTDVPAFSRPDFATVYATYFDQRVQNLIGLVYSPVFTEANLASAHMHGVETEFRLRPASWLDLHATYTLLATNSDGQPASQSTQLLRRPQNTASFDVTIKPVSGLKIITTVLYTGPAQDYLYDNNSFGTGYGVGQHGTIVNLSATYKLMPAVELYLTGWNILNSKYEPVNGYQTPGPTVVAGARMKL